MQVTHDNHYVPQFYLKNWSMDGKTVQVYSVLVSNKAVPLWEEKSISRIASLNDLYTRVEGEMPIDDFETTFNTEYESPAVPVFEKIKREKRLNSQDWAILLKFVALQSIRTPAKLNALLKQWETEVPQIMQDTLEKLKAAVKQPNFTTYPIEHLQKSSVPLPIKTNIDREKGLLSLNAVVGKSWYLYAVEHILNGVSSVLQNHEWHIIHSPNGILWPTSDDPVICLNYTDINHYDFKGGWGRKNGEIIFPLTPHHLLYTCIGNKMNDQKLHKLEQNPELFIKLIIEHSFRYVFSVKPIKFIHRFKPRRINAEDFDNEKSQLHDWHIGSVQAEKGLK